MCGYAQPLVWLRTRTQLAGAAVHYACAPPRFNYNLKTGAGQRVQCMCIIRRTGLVYSLLDRRLWGCRYNPNMEYAAFTHLIARLPSGMRESEHRIFDARPVSCLSSAGRGDRCVSYRGAISGNIRPPARGRWRSTPRCMYLCVSEPLRPYRYAYRDRTRRNVKAIGKQEAGPRAGAPSRRTC